MIDKLIQKVTAAAASLPPGTLELLFDVVSELVRGRPESIDQRLRKVAMAIGLKKGAGIAMEQAANAAARLKKTGPK
jgi:ABC-type transporter Mla subunit MlaD